MNIETMSDQEIVVSWNYYSQHSWQFGEEEKTKSPILGFINWLLELPCVVISNGDKSFCEHVRKYSRERNEHSKDDRVQATNT